jgi:threonine 3-dehydrogenase
MQKVMKGLIKEEPKPGAAYKTDIPVPHPDNNAVLVKVRYTAICGTDIHIYNWNEYAQQRIKLPMIFGHEFSGDIIETGSYVNKFKPGDRVAGETHIPCNKCIECLTGNQHNCENMKILGVHVDGSFAEYIAVPQDCLWKLDDEMDYKTGALLEPMGVAVHGVFSGEISRKNVVILGCGPIGLMAVASCVAGGAAKVFAVDIFDDKLKMAKELGAEYVYNTKTDDFIANIMDVTKGRGADVIIDYSAHTGLIAKSFAALRKGGRFTFVGLPGNTLVLNPTDDIIYKEAIVNGVTGRLMYKTWFQCNELLLSGSFDMDKIIGGVYKLNDYEKAFDALKNGAVGKMIFEF